MKIFLLIMLFVFQPQDDYVKTRLQKKVEEAESPGDKIAILNSFVRESAYHDSEMLRYCGNQIYRIGKDSEKLGWKCIGLFYLIRADQLVRDFDAIDNNLDLLEKTIGDANYDRGKYILALTKGKTLELRSKLGEALIQYLKALEIAKKTQQLKSHRPGLQAAMYEYISNIYDKMDQSDEFLEYNSKATEIAANAGNDVFFTEMLLRRCNHYLRKNEITKAEELIKKIKAVAEKNKMEQYLIDADIITCHIWIMKYKNNDNIKLLEEAKSIAKTASQRSYDTPVILTLAEIEYHLGNHEEALRLVQELLKFPRDHIEPEYKKRILILQSKIYEKTGKSYLAIKYLREYYEQENKECKTYLSEYITILKQNYLIMKTEKESELEGQRADILKKDAEISRLILISQLGGAVFLLIILTILYANRRKIKRFEIKLNSLDRRDNLTNLLKRRPVNEIIENEISRYGRNQNDFSVVISDIDHLGIYNDLCGNKSGDKALQNVSKILQDNIMKHECVARWGDDEFIILLPETNAMEAVLVADKLRGKIEEFQFDCQNGEKITMSFGVCQYKDSLNPAEFINLALEAMKRAKQNGRNRVELADN